MRRAIFFGIFIIDMRSKILIGVSSIHLSYLKLKISITFLTVFDFLVVFKNILNSIIFPLKSTP